VSPDKREIAELAVDAVLHRITTDAEAPHTRLIAGYELVVRESTRTAEAE
jgi:DNA-binding LacI/PurR family transcriptional regulator